MAKIYIEALADRGIRGVGEGSLSLIEMLQEKYTKMLIEAFIQKMILQQIWKM